MKVDWTKHVTDLDNNAITDESGNTVTLGQLAMRSLWSGNERMSGEDKFKRDTVARKIHAGDELTIEDAALVKSAVGETLTPMAVGLIWRELEAAK